MRLYRCELTWKAAVYVLAESEEQAMRGALREEFGYEFPEVTVAEVRTLSRLHKNDHTCIPAGENPNCLTIAEHFGVKQHIVVPIDLSAGTEQEYVEDCPVCCRPNVVHVEVDEEGDVRVWAEGE